LPPEGVDLLVSHQTKFNDPTLSIGTSALFENEEQSLAETVATEEAFEALPRIAAELGTDPQVVDWARQEYEANLAAVRAKGSDDDPAMVHSRDHAELRLALVAHKRATVVRLRDERRIDDTVLRRLQAALDDEEVRLTGREVE